MNLNSPLRLLALVLCCACISRAQTADSADPLAMAARIQNEVARIRGLPFKHAVPMDKQKPEELGRRMDKEMKHAVSPAMATHFDKIVRRLGLYNGPVITDYRSLMRQVMTSQVAAYYDDDRKHIYLLDDSGGDMEQGVTYAHELYHALQDQHFDLKSFTSPKLHLNADQEMARVALVEGEATYIHTLWGIGQMTNGVLPPRDVIASAINTQAGMSFEEMRGMAGNSKAAAEADNIPQFILETLIGNYMKGAAFVSAVQETGWSAIEKMYREYPPQSTEQILHPGKWVAHENPSIITWTNLSKQKALRNWELLDDDVIGEIQWRVIFQINGQQAEAEDAAAGWDGDRYAVFKRKGSDETLLLLRTAWDSEAEAAEFTAAYRRLLAVKYAGSAEATRVEQQGEDVFIVEGGQETDLDALLAIVKQAKKDPSRKVLDTVVQQAPAVDTGRTLDELETVLVTGERPGPALWKVTRKGKDNVLWILPAFGPLPDSLVLRSAQLERVISESQGIHFLRSINPPPSLANDTRTRAAYQNSNGMKLGDVVSPELHAQFKQLNDRYAGGNELMESYRPTVAADWLKQNAMLRLHLSDRAVVTTIRELANKYGVTIWGVKMTHDEVWDTMIARLDKVPREKDAPCAKAQLDRLEADLAQAVDRANAWAKGDIATLREDKELYAAQKGPKICAEYYKDINVGMVQQRALMSYTVSASAKWLKENRSTLIVVPIADLFENAGLITKLKRAGYNVEEPRALSNPGSEE